MAAPLLAYKKIALCDTYGDESVDNERRIRYNYVTVSAYAAEKQLY